MGTRFTPGHKLFCLVGFYVLWLLGTLVLQLLGNISGNVLIAVASVGAGLTIIGGLRLARSLNQLLYAGVGERVTQGLHQMQVTASHIAQVESASACEELSTQASEVAAIATELLELTGGRTPSRGIKGLAGSPGARRKPVGGTDDISDFWELSNPH